MIGKLDNKSFFTLIVFIFISIVQAATDILLIISLIPILTKISEGSIAIGFQKLIYISWGDFLRIFGISGVWKIAGFTGLINALFKINSYYLGLKFALEATSEISQKVFKSRIYS